MGVSSPSGLLIKAVIAANSPFLGANLYMKYTNIGNISWIKYCKSDVF
jgi:hypothetical protein